MDRVISSTLRHSSIGTGLRSHLGLGRSVASSASSQRSSRGPSGYGVVVFIVVNVKCRDLLVAVEMRTCEEEEEIYGAQDGQKPVEQVEAASVEVVSEPWLRAPIVAGDAVHRRDKHGAQEMAARDGAQVDRGAQASHAVGRFSVEELQLPDLREDFGASAEEVLRDEPEDGDRDSDFREVHEPVCSCYVHSLHLLTNSGKYPQSEHRHTNFFSQVLSFRV